VLSGSATVAAEASFSDPAFTRSGARHRGCAYAATGCHAADRGASTTSAPRRRAARVVRSFLCSHA
jgi:hypothetical protein